MAFLRGPSKAEEAHLLAALIRTGKQTQKKSYCASVPRGKSTRLLECTGGS